MFITALLPEPAGLYLGSFNWEQAALKNQEDLHPAPSGLRPPAPEEPADSQPDFQELDDFTFDFSFDPTLETSFDFSSSWEKSALQNTAGPQPDAPGLQLTSLEKTADSQPDFQELDDLTLDFSFDPTLDISFDFSSNWEKTSLHDTAGPRPDAPGLQLTSPEGTADPHSGPCVLKQTDLQEATEVQNDLCNLDLPKVHRCLVPPAPQEPAATMPACEYTVNISCFIFIQSSSTEKQRKQETKKQESHMFIVFQGKCFMK